MNTSNPAFNTDAPQKSAAPRRLTLRWAYISMIKLVSTIFVAILLPITPAHADEPCSPRDKLLDNPYVRTVNKCIYYLSHTLKEVEQRRYAEKLITRALTDKKHGNRGLDILSYVELAELAALLNTPEVIDVFLTFIARPVDGDESRSQAIGRLYELRAPLVLDRLALRKINEQEIIIDSIAWGAANNFYLFMNIENYRRLAVGANWDVLDSKHPHRALSKRIEKSLEYILLDTWK